MNNENDFKIGILGAGTVGLTLAACLKISKVDYSILTKTIPTNNLNAFIEGNEITLDRDRFIASYDQKHDKNFNLIISTVKRYDLIESAELCRTLLAPNGFILSVQNGIHVQEDYGDMSSRVIHAPIFIVSKLSEKGIVISKKPEIVLPDHIDCKIGGLETADSINLLTSPDINQSIWKKMIFVSSISGICSLLNADVKTIKSNPEYTALFKSALTESFCVAKEECTSLEPTAVDSALASFGMLPDGFRPSMAYDFIHHRRSEVDWLSGTISDLGKKRALPVTVHDRIFQDFKQREKQYVT